MDTVPNDAKITQFYFHIGGEASLWDITMNPSTQGPTLEQLQKVGSVISTNSLSTFARFFMLYVHVGHVSYLTVNSLNVSTEMI